ncbi:hypothetical protein DID88_007752 [Monilinia fructigena]|uniref:Class II aldolase/adducin N-terminal domain-containing protein n=1 Tax=Monilinia fructigena TaxID=38457 RepID=A0A395J3Q7_9HELO|nr:hypothetical protein DID88_007752 [Monilinia fructigena]
MSPPSALAQNEIANSGVAVPSISHFSDSAVTHEPELSKEQAKTRAGSLKLPIRIPLEDKYAERNIKSVDWRWHLEFLLNWGMMRGCGAYYFEGSYGEVVDGGPCRLLNTAAYMIHHAVHIARPEVNAVAHSHSIYGRAFCSLGRPLDIITQDACAFHNDLALYSSFRGVVLASEEGHAIASALGQKKAALLQNHGLLTCGESIESAVFWFTSLEKCCHAQLLADAAAGGRGGETVKIDEQDAVCTYNTVGRRRQGIFRPSRPSI